MKDVDSFRMRLYALTCVACVVWLAQSLRQSYLDGSLWSAANIIFSLCIAVAVVYTGSNAFVLSKAQRKTSEAEDPKEDGSEG